MVAHFIILSIDWLCFCVAVILRWHSYKYTLACICYLFGVGMNKKCMLHFVDMYKICNFASLLRKDVSNGM